MSQQSIRKLYRISQKKDRIIMGLMSGTSLDGLDMACCTIRGSGTSTHTKLLHFETKPYSNKTKQFIRQVTAQKEISFQALSELNISLAHLHAHYILNALKKWGLKSEDIDILASHGQTVFHAPKKSTGAIYNSTFQIIDGDHLAYLTNIITLSDFRQKHVAAGGEGAPLAEYGDQLLFSSDKESRILLNIGGIANYTYLPQNKKKRIVTDTGPGNTLMDWAMRNYFQKPYDRHGRIAQQGRVNYELLTHLKTHPFFKYPIPKTTGPEYFNAEFIQSNIANLTNPIEPECIVATLAQLTIDTIGDSIKKIQNVQAIYVSGGGANNPILMKGLQQVLPTIKINRTDILGIPVDAKEAVLFATLANESIGGVGTSVNSKFISFGKISFPD